MNYVDGDATQPSSTSGSQGLEEIATRCGTGGNVLFYLAMPPDALRRDRRAARARPG